VLQGDKTRPQHRVFLLCIGRQKSPKLCATEEQTRRNKDENTSSVKIFTFMQKLAKLDSLDV
jgi:hypothetical protein